MSIATTTINLAHPRFVSELPPTRPSSKKKTDSLLEILQKRPGEWALVAKYPADRASAASARGHGWVRRHPGQVEYATRTVATSGGDQVNLYMRAVEA